MANAGNLLTVQVASGESLDVRNFTVEEGLSRLFEVQLTAMSSNVDVDFEGAIGQNAQFQIQTSDGRTRFWTGLCARAAQGRAEPSGLSTYHFRIVPTMWLLTQRRNYRVFQDKSELDIVLLMLQEWGIQPQLELDAGNFNKRRMRVQYAESDFDFVNRLLEDIGVCYSFEQVGSETKLTLLDAPNRRSPGPAVPFTDSPNPALRETWVTDVQTHREVRPGKYTQSDVDYRRPLNYPLASSSSGGSDVEAKLERYHHNYGSLLWHAEPSGDTPTADDRGAARTSERIGQTQVQRRLDAQRVHARALRFRTNEHSLAPGMVMTITGHARKEVGAPLLVVASQLNGTSSGNWIHICETRYTDVSYRPPLRTPKPKTHGIESATVTGPAGEEIHTDELGRVRIHFHWDREGAADETSSCWVPQSQPWAGAGFGGISLARVGQEVLIDFLGADPDRPVVVGRVYTTTTPPPYQLPKHKMVSGLCSETYPRPKAAPRPAPQGGGPAGKEPAGGGMPVSAYASPSTMQGYGNDYNPESEWAQNMADNTQRQEARHQAEAKAHAREEYLRGGPHASIDDLDKAINALKSNGPYLKDHYRSANALMHDDTAHHEKMYIQAQKDLYATVKDNLAGTVGGDRAFTILRNDITRVQQFQLTEVGDDRSVAVGGDQAHFVQGEMTVQCQKNILTVTPEGGQYASAITDIELYGKQAIVENSDLKIQLGVGPSTILMTPEGIVIDAPNVYINPGAQMMAALAAGKSMTDAAEIQKKYTEAQEAAKAAAEKPQADEDYRYAQQLSAEWGGGF